MTEKTSNFIVSIIKIVLWTAIITTTVLSVVIGVQLMKEKETPAPVPEVVVTVPTEQEDLRDYAREQAELLEVDPDKFIRLITCESQWNPKAKNPVSSARGLLQYLSGTWETTRSNYQGYSRFDPYASIREAVLDIANGQQSMWQECLDKDGINFY